MERLEKLFPDIAAEPYYASRKQQVIKLRNEMYQYMTSAIEEQACFQGITRTITPLIREVAKDD